MKNILNLIKCILFLGAGIAILLLPYDKLKAVFLNAPLPFVVKAMSFVVPLCVGDSTFSFRVVGVRGQRLEDELFAAR